MLKKADGLTWLEGAAAGEFAVNRDRQWMNG